MAPSARCSRLRARSVTRTGWTFGAGVRSRGDCKFAPQKLTGALTRRQKDLYTFKDPEWAWLKVAKEQDT